MTFRSLPMIPWRRTALSTARYSGQSAQAVHEQALDLFVLGFYKQANVLLKALYDYGYGLEFDLDTNMRTCYDPWEHFDCLPALYEAWKTYGCLPSWIEHPHPEKPFHGRDHIMHDKPLWNDFKDKWADGLPEVLRQDALEDGYVGNAALQGLLRQLEVQDPNIMSGTRKSLGAVVQASMLAGDLQMARSIVEKDVTNLYRHFQDPSHQPDVYTGGLRTRLNKRLGLHHAPKMWGHLKDVNIGKALGIGSESVDEYVAEGCELIKQRFKEGPTRPYADKSIADLVHLLVEAKQAEVIANWGPDHVANNLKPPATEEEIAELETRLVRTPALSNYQVAHGNSSIDPGATPLLPEGSLPDDYKDFLRVTNGLYQDGPYPVAGPNNPGNLFYGIEGIDVSDDELWVHDLDFTLFPLDSSISGDNIALGDFTGFSIGAGGDEGQALLIPPSSMKRVLADFEKTYAAADERGKREYDSAALDVYGGIERLRNMEWLCVETFHWDPDPTMYDGFRGYLEHCVEEAVKKVDELHEKEAEGKDIAEEEDDNQEGKSDSEANAGGKRKRGSVEDELAHASDTMQDQTNKTADSETSDRTSISRSLHKSKAQRT